MSQKLYLECTSGISGDMAVAALLDLGADEQVLKEALNSIPVSGFEIKISRVKKAGLDACDFHVILNREHENHDHDMEYLHGERGGHHPSLGQEHRHSQGHIHEEQGHHSHQEHSKEHHYHHSHHHEHRGLPEILELIEQCHMTESAKMIARRIFDIIAEAEAKAHGLPKNEVHFHEVGAVDSIVDIIAVAVCFDNLGISDVVVPVLYEGCGSVRCQHGILPVPVPATANIVEKYQLVLHKMKFQGEFVTPTGAAIVAALKTENELPERFSIIKIGIGAGKREYEKASLLRAMILESREENTDFIYKLESNVDDCTGENLGYLMDKLFESGARDVNYTPIYMKKNRPAYEIHIICDKDKVSLMEQILFEETTTIGIRKIAMERSMLKREIKEIDTEYGKLRVKICDLSAGKRYYPEYEDVVRMAGENQIPFPTMYQILSGKLL